MRVLVCQDDEGNREVAVEALRQEGWAVVATAEPPTLDLVRAHDPSAIVIDGHHAAFLGVLRASGLGSTPVVMWTAMALRPDAIAALESDYPVLAIVHKPNMLPDLPDAIRSLLAVADRTRAERERGAADG